MLRSIGLATVLALLLVACGGGSGGGGTVGGDTGVASTGGGTGAVISAPQNLQYFAGIPQVGLRYGPYPPYVSGTVTGFSVNPALPAGLMLDPASGVISGTPQAAAPTTTYIFTASNTGGSVTAALTFAVLVPPTLAYVGPVTGTVGQALAPLVPTLGGNADAISAYPPLPDGLTLDPVTGIVSGTPSRERVAMTYLITARNGSGASATADLVLAVDPPRAGTAVTGAFRDDTVIGLGYVSGSHSGVTDASGTFTYEEGQGVAFSVGAVRIGVLPVAKPLVTPVDLFPHGTALSSHVLNVVRFLVMLDQDGNPNNGIQISPAVTAAAASWAPVDFDSVDLPTTLGPLIQQANAIDGVTHVLPDAATAQAHLLKAFYCTHAGTYNGTFAEGGAAAAGRGAFNATVLPYGGMHAIASASSTLVGFDAHTGDAASTLLDGAFTQISTNPSVSLQGSFADAPVLHGTYQAAAAGSFEAVADASVAATYKFTGSYTQTPTSTIFPGPFSAPFYIGVDDSNHISGFPLGNMYGGLVVNTLAGTVSGSTFTGTASYSYPGNGRPHTLYTPVSGSYSNTSSGIAFNAQFMTSGEIVTFSATGCRAN
jgi:hypothetical protein